MGVPIRGHVVEFEEVERPAAAPRARQGSVAVVGECDFAGGRISHEIPRRPLSRVRVIVNFGSGVEAYLAVSSVTTARSLENEIGLRFWDAALDARFCFHAVSIPRQAFTITPKSPFRLRGTA